MVTRIQRLLKNVVTAIYIELKSLLGIKTTTFKLKSGGLFKIRNVDKIGLQVLKGVIFEKAVIDIISSVVEEGMTVLDIGANIGYYSIVMARKVLKKGKVIAFEPNPAVFKELEYNIKLNNFTNVIMEQIALSDVNGSAKLYVPEIGNEAHGSLEPNDTFNVAVSLDIKTEQLDSALQRMNISRVDFIKIDAEGAEKLIFNGAQKLLSSSYKPIIVFECSENLCKGFGHRVFDVLDYIVKYGYILEQLSWGEWFAAPVK